MRKVADDEVEEEEGMKEGERPVCNKTKKEEKYTVTRLADHHKDQVLE